MPRTSREINDHTLGGRLEQFRPMARGEELKDYEWAQKIPLSAKQLGVLLKNRAHVRVPVIQAVAHWMVSAGYSPEAVVWWIIGGQRPQLRNREKRPQRQETGKDDGHALQ